jgi:hypothetical protein
MSDKPISVGDLVVVVRGHVCDLGETFIVTRIDRWSGGWVCTKCGEESDDDYVGASPSTDPMDRHCVPLPWLKRIPPLSELEGERTQEEMKEPA